MTRNRILVNGLLLMLLVVIESISAQEYNANPFLNNGYANDVNAFIADQERANQIDMTNNVFLSHAISNRAAAFSGPAYLPPNEKQLLICSGQEVCVSKNSCQNGYFSQKPAGGRTTQNCDYDTEVCCLYNPPPTPVPSTPCTGNNFACVPPNNCRNGEISTNNFIKSSSGKCYAPEVCCRIPEPESTVLDKNGYHLKVPEKPFDIPSRPTPKPYSPQPYSPVTQAPYRPTEKPYQQTPQPYQPTQAPYRPTQKPYQPTQKSYDQTPAPYQPTQKPYQPTQAPYQPTQKPYQPTQAPYQPTQAPYQPTQKPYQPTQAPYQPTQKPYQPTQAPYQPTQKPYQPTQAPYQPTQAPYRPTQAPYQPTQKPYQPTQAPYQPTQKPYQPTQAPYQPTQKPYQPTQAPYQPTQKPYQPTQAPYQPTQAPYRPTAAPRTPSTSAPEYLPPTRQPQTRPPQTRPPVTRQPQTRPPPTRQPTTRQPYVPQPTKPISGDEILSYPIPKNTPRPPIIGNDILNEPQLPPVTCAAALNCTRTEYCSMTGVIQETPVSLTPEQELFRVPMTQCQDLVQGFTGVCCRDPNYVDPWPVSQLGQYNAKDFGDDGTYKPNPGIARTQRRANANKNQKRIVRQKPASAQCVNRNTNTILKGDGPIDANFGEYPWQAMVLLESSKSLLCGGVIVGDNVVATAAHCVAGRKPFDVLIKAGEWKLGRDEEPLGFQISRAKKIEIHPKYDPASFKFDIALLHLDSKLIFDTHIGPICIDDTDPKETEQCVTTGWGKEVLRVHAQDAIMHHSAVTAVSRDQCGADESRVCGKTAVDGCELDPGSALACANENGQYVLKGIYSTEDKCGDTIVSFTKPDATWLNSSINNRGKSVATKYLSNGF